MSAPAPGAAGRTASPIACCASPSALPAPPDPPAAEPGLPAAALTARMDPRDRDALIEAALTVWRPRSPDGRIHPYPTQADLSREDREAVFDATLRARPLEDLVDLARYGHQVCFRFHVPRRFPGHDRAKETLDNIRSHAMISLLFAPRSTCRKASGGVIFFRGRR